MDKTLVPSTKTPLVGDILIVDDTPANLRLLSDMLAKQGYNVRTAPDGSLALISAQAIPPDLILLDIRMPGMNGYKVCEELKAHSRTHDIPIIFISALDQTEDKAKAFTLGGVDYVTKPFHFEEVLARIETHLALHTLQRQLAAANTELETFAHDLKSPLDIILGYSVLLESDLAQMSPEEIATSLNCITKMGYKVRDIIEAHLLSANVRQADEV